jgi:hypothetical protein
LQNGGYGDISSKNALLWWFLQRKRKKNHHKRAFLAIIQREICIDYRVWLQNKAVSWEICFLPFAQDLLTRLAQQTILLAIDGNEARRGSHTSAACYVLRFCNALYRTSFLNCSPEHGINQ